MKKPEDPMYRLFHSAKGRCENPNNHKFESYGGRGIEMRFKDHHEMAKELGQRPGPLHSIDRIDNNGHYEVGNVKWSCPKQQARNKSNTRMITSGGKTQSLHDWAEQTGLSPLTISSRINKLGWSEEDSVKPTGGKNKMITFNGETMNIKSWSKKIGVKFSTLCARFDNGWSIEKALTTKLRKQKQRQKH